MLFVDPVEIANGPLFPDPLFNVRVPARPIGAYFTHQMKGLRVDFKDIRLDHDLLGRIETAQIEDAVLVKQPFACGIKVGLGRTPLDLVVDLILYLVGERDPGIVRREQSRAQQAAHHENGQTEAANR